MNKRFRILVLLCCALALACLGLGLEYAQARREIQRLEDEKNALRRFVSEAKRRQRIAEGLACRGDAPPLSDGELFALGMQDYWKREMKKLWRIKDIPATRANCRPSSNGCYPWKLPEYATVEQLKAGLRKITGNYTKDKWLHQLRRPDELYYETIVREVLHGTVNYPETERMYHPEHVDGSTTFGVLHNIGEWIKWYGADCCRLMSHAEAIADVQDLKQRGHWGMTGYPGEDTDDLPPGKSLKDLRYLRIQRCTVDRNIAPGLAGVRYFAGGSISGCHSINTEYYLLSPCGTLISCGTLIF